MIIQTIKGPMELGTLIDIDSITIINNLFAIHSAILFDPDTRDISVSTVEWSITHLPTGRAVFDPFYDDKLAYLVAQEIANNIPEMQRNIVKFPFEIVERCKDVKSRVIYNYKNPANLDRGRLRNS